MTFSPSSSRLTISKKVTTFPLRDIDRWQTKTSPGGSHNAESDTINIIDFPNRARPHDEDGSVTLNLHDNVPGRNLLRLHSLLLV
jgi:hypothetical protein